MCKHEGRVFICPHKTSTKRKPYMNINVHQLANKSMNISSSNEIFSSVNETRFTPKIHKVINHLIGAGYRLGIIQSIQAGID